MASNQQVKLFGIVGSPFVSRIKIALKLKGVEYEYIHESLTTKSDLLLSYNPIHKKVPVLLHNDKPICESLVILEYVDETWTGFPFLPFDPHHRALARFWSKFIDDKVFPVIFKAAWNPDVKEREKGGEEACESLVILEYVDETWTGFTFLPFDPYHRALACFWSKFIDDKVLPGIFKAAWNPDVEEREKGGEEAFQALRILENELKGKFFNGDSIGYVDIAGLFLAFWLPLIEEASGNELFSDEKFPKLKKWSHEILKHPIIEEALPPKDYLIAYYRTRFKGIADSKG